MNSSLSARAFHEFVPRKESRMNTPDLVSAAQDVLLQGLNLLFEINDSGFARIAKAPFNASIGQHYRHVLEHFQSVIRGAHAGHVNYDERQRNRRMETEVSYASIATCDVLRALKRYTDESLAQCCKVTNSVGYSNALPSTFDSNVSRELAYCAGHAIHHYAIIRLICHEQAITVPNEFGIAPSTLRNLAATAAD